MQQKFTADSDVATYSTLHSVWPREENGESIEMSDAAELPQKHLEKPFRFTSYLPVIAARPDISLRKRARHFRARIARYGSLIRDFATVKPVGEEICDDLSLKNVLS